MPACVVTLYNSRSHIINEQSLRNLLAQLPPPVILMGDFDSYHPLWVNFIVDGRGQQVATFITKSNLNVLNDGSPTRITSLSETAVDLAIVSPILQPTLLWSVMHSTYDSDHNPIMITFTSDSIVQTSTRYSINRANWTHFKSSRVWSDLPAYLNDIDNEDMITDLYSRLNRACEDSIPRVTIRKFYP